MYKYKLSSHQLEIMQTLEITEDEFKLYFQSEDTFNVPCDENGYMNNSIFNPVLTTLVNSRLISQELQQEFNIKIIVTHSWRHPLTTKRLIEKGFNASKTSDHMKGLAIDGNIYKYEDYSWIKVLDNKLLLSVGKWLWAKRVRYKITQLGLYNIPTFSGGCHIGFNNKSTVSFFQKF